MVETTEKICPYYSNPHKLSPDSPWQTLKGSCTKYGSLSVNLNFPTNMSPCLNADTKVCPIFNHKPPFGNMMGDTIWQCEDGTVERGTMEAIRKIIQKWFEDRRLCDPNCESCHRNYRYHLIETLKSFLSCTVEMESTISFLDLTYLTRRSYISFAELKKIAKSENVTINPDVKEFFNE